MQGYTYLYETKSITEKVLQIHSFLILMMKTKNLKLGFYQKIRGYI